ncbi:hypothetical protein, partial [Microbacterium arabinogalactanolyticum]|uniref:hypothetical protein n=1 Tax=Microbacterium arabinogalactanolyticum TaxID=69365 RepID=UPI003CD0763A
MRRLYVLQQRADVRQLLESMAHARQIARTGGAQRQTRQNTFLIAHLTQRRLQIREREKLGLDTLKVGFNGVHGYYIQVSRGQSHLVPIHYVRRQTLKNAERYIIPELKEYEDKVLTSKGKALAIEKSLYDELFDLLLPHLAELQQSAAALAELDVLANLA